MPFASIEAYLNKLEARKAEVMLMMSDVVMLPHMKKSDRTSTLNGWMKLLSIHSPNRTKVASPARLRLMGIKVTKVEKKKSDL